MIDMQALANRLEELERRVEVVEDNRTELRLLRAAVENHSFRISGLESKVDILIDGQAQIMAILRNRE